MTLHELLDSGYGTDGADRLRELLASGADVAATAGPLAETALHVAARRCRADAVSLLLEAGADADARTA
ncbi:MAG: ankyrin repeat domain-containing protein, partial [Gemmatimonadetes bacterium]|nr:ankyrin repeat domain-containing protein [Gemmatimonadota bacterium]